MATSTIPKIFLGLYEALRPLGEGGMGKVYLGRHRQTGREVVIKVMHEHLARNPKMRKSFEREMQMMVRFRHPHAVALLDGALDGPSGPCLIMEYIRGQTLEEILKRQRRLPVDRVGKILGQLCLVLHAAHGAGILHRDLAPGNIMLIDPDTPREQVKVMDFGLARADGFYLALDKLKGKNVIDGGTPDYLCPEQIRGDDVDHRGDLYSVGVMLYEMLTGQVPFAACQDINAILHAHLDQLPPAFAALRVLDVPATVEGVVGRCLAKFPHERPQSARDLIGQFELAAGRHWLDQNSFSGPERSPPPSQPQADPSAILDQFDAWMPEAVAVMKLRGFIEGVGGKIIDSVPGLITMAVADPRVSREEPKGLFGRLGLSRPKITASAPLTLELHLRKKQEGGRSLVEIAVVLAASRNHRADLCMREGFGQRLCRELRSYLMIGR